MDTEQKVNPISFRLDARLLADVDELAMAERRSRNAMLVRLLELGIGVVRHALAVGTTIDFAVGLKAVEPSGKKATAGAADSKSVEAGKETVKHDRSKCRIYKCGMCAALKEEK
jgi:hypothetical protein